ncbi:hypothetical protein NUKP65_51210 [Klebsiella variicola]|nr:hypothetical protein NUKP65_51210 [Klebsiella variicola]
MALTDIKVRSAKPQEKEYTLVNGDGMFLLIHPNGSKYWRFRFRFGGKQHLMAFGFYPETSLADVRQKREEGRKLVAAGIDPWSDPMPVDKFCPHDEACSKVSGLTPPR